MSCVSDPSYCFTPYLPLPIPQIEANLNPFVDNTVGIAFIYDQSIGRLVLPSNSMKANVTNDSYIQDTVQRITVYPVPTS